MKFKESMLKLYAAPLSETEDAQCKHAIEAIRDALKDLGYTDDQRGVSLLESDTLAYSVSMRNKYSTEKVHIFIQGSYANNTCVRNESDVDIAVMRDDIHESAFGEKFELFTADKKHEATKLKDAVERVLRNNFPYQVKRGNKSIKVNGNTYRKQADTVPCLSMHYYYRSNLKDYLTPVGEGVAQITLHKRGYSDSEYAQYAYITVKVDDPAKVLHMSASKVEAAVGEELELTANVPVATYPNAVVKISSSTMFLSKNPQIKTAHLKSTEKSAYFYKQYIHYF